MADQATHAPTPADLERAEKFTREPFLFEGEDAAAALAPGTPAPRRVRFRAGRARRRPAAPSVEWRRRFSLLLGLERLLSEEEPHLVDGTVLSAHQVDALSGTLTALLAEAQRNGNGTASALRPTTSSLAPVGIPGEEPEATRTTTSRRSRGLEPGADEDDDAQLDEQPEDPDAAKRFWSSTPPAPARPSPRSASSRRLAPAAS